MSFRIEVLLWRTQNNNSELSFQGSNQMIIENLDEKFPELKHKFSYSKLECPFLYSNNNFLN